jgi:16S rRNA (cytidine1402-2'-O)-methyltransferase
MAGNLYIVATPIGNLRDITLRALDILKSVDLIACEDTRHSRILLANYAINKPLTSYYEQNRARKIPYIIEGLKAGKNVALISEAGTPAISDPGFLLVKTAIEEGINVIPVPGPSAVATAVSGAGLPTNGFVFLGFLPRKKGKIKKAIEPVAQLGKTVIFYESPFRLKGTLETMAEFLPADTDVVIARELTKKFEEFIRGNLADIRNKLPEKVRGEITVLFSVNRDSATPDEETISQM